MPARRPAGKRVFWRTKTTRSVFSSRALCSKRHASERAGDAANQVIIKQFYLKFQLEIKRNKKPYLFISSYTELRKLNYEVRRDFKIESSLAVVRATAVVLREETRSSAAYSNNIHIAVVLIKARISAARLIPGICGETEKRANLNN